MENEKENKEVSDSETGEVEKTVEGEVGEPEKKPEVKDEIPSAAQKRIDELTWQKKTAEEKLAILEKERGAKTVLTEEEEREKKAKNYLRDLMKEVREEEKTAETEADEQLKEEIRNVTSLYPDFDEKSVLNLMDKYGIESVERGYQVWKEISKVKVEAKDETKKEILSRPKSPSGVKTTDEGVDQTSEADKKKSLWEIVEEAKKKAGI